jgi:hypothetical protein
MFLKVNDSFEMRLKNSYSVYIDLFLVYKEKNQTKQTCGYQVGRRKYKRNLPEFNELCSAELLNQKHLVPCDPVKYLDNEYGKNQWQTPKSSHYTWSNLVSMGNWSDNEWPKSIRYYEKNGSFNLKRTLKDVNKYSNKNLTQL